MPSKPLLFVVEVEVEPAFCATGMAEAETARTAAMTKEVRMVGVVDEWWWFW